MRISKVKVSVDNGPDKMVLMKRTNKEGMLVYSSDSNGEMSRTDEIIPKKKKDSFKLSITNKTLVKPKKENDEYKALRSLINEEHPNWYNLTGITKERPTKDYLNKRFQGTFEYTDAKGETIKFDLAELIIRAKSQKSLAPLAPYYNWKKWFIDTKGEALKKSIKNNRIQLDAEEDSKLSFRKRALRNWAPEFSKSGTLDLKDIQEVYAIDQLVDKLNNKDQDPDGPQLKGRKKYNEYHCALKKALQKHQKGIFGSREEPNKENRENVQLYVYNMEVTKYLEHYFPVKKSARRNTEDDNNYYLQLDTIKRTVRHQIENAVRLDRIQQGKFEHHKCDNQKEISSNRLTDIKADESFALHLSELCAFAANNIRNMVDKEQTKDILGKDDFQASLNLNNSKEELFKFFYDKKTKSSSDDKDTLRTPADNDKWAMQQAVAQIRHEVVHYRKEALDKIFAIDSFNGSSKYTNTIFKQCLERDKEKLPKYFAEQLKTGNVLDYYPMDTLQGFLSNHKFMLYRSVVPFAPGFKNVMEKGRNHQHADGNTDFYDLELNCYPIQKDKYVEAGGDGEAYEARYFLMKLVYNNMFLPTFTGDNPQLFRCSVSFVRNRNHEHADEQAREKAKSKGHKDWQNQRAKAWAFKDVPPMKAGTSVKKYMAEVQSNLMLEYNKKKEELEQQAKHPSNDEEVRQNFKKFLLQVFAKGFNDYIRDNRLNFILEPQKETGRPNDKKDYIVESCKGAINSDTIDTSKENHIAFYTFCKLLDANHLSTLRNELIKYRSATEEGKIAQNNIQKTEELLAIIELCLFSADAVSQEEVEYDMEEVYKPFIQDDVSYWKWDIYTQSDDFTPVIHRTIALSRNYGTEELLKAIIGTNADFRIMEKDYDDWENSREKIKDKVARRVELHEQWVKAKEKDAGTRDPKYKYAVKNFMKQHQSEYKKLCDDIDRHDWLDNKLKFEHLRRLHNLTIEILARLSGFVTLWERDFRYYDQKMKLNNSKTMNWKEDSGIPEHDERKVYKGTFLPKDFRCVPTRNHIAHFNYLTTAAGEYSIIDLINNVRKMLFYDRKLKNAVNKAMIKLFDKHGMELKFKRNADDTFSIADLKPKSIYHLGTKGENAVTTYRVTEEFRDMCRALLELKNGGK